MGWRGRAHARRRDERGASAVELVIYMPLLMLVILLAVQFSMIYLGNQSANAVARETARVARVDQDARAAKARGHVYAATIGRGVLEDVDIDVTPIGSDRVRVVVSGRAQELVFGVPRVVQTIEGPIEEFRRY